MSITQSLGEKSDLQMALLTIVLKRYMPMVESNTPQGRILMYPCAGSCYAGQLTRQAVQGLVIEGKGLWLGPKQCLALSLPQGNENCASAFIVVDGCKRHCGKMQLAAGNGHPEFHLCLSDLAIEKKGPANAAGDTLQLVKDAISAECTRLTDRPPAIPGGCGCR